MDYYFILWKKEINSEGYTKVSEQVIEFPNDNLLPILESSMNWEVFPNEIYACSEVKPMIESGIKNMMSHPEDYVEHNSGESFTELAHAIKGLVLVKQNINNLEEDTNLDDIYISLFSLKSLHKHLKRKKGIFAKIISFFEYFK